MTATNVRLDRARDLLRSRLPGPVRTERLPLRKAARRVVGESIVADRNVPHYRRAALDGYAVRSDDTTGASRESPVTLVRTTETVAEGTAQYVDTGAEIPRRADAVVRLERLNENEDTIDVLDPVGEGKDVAPAGEDVSEGTELYGRGQQLTPADLGVLRSLGIEEVRVFEQPRVAVIPTGDEIVSADPDPGQVIETNGLMLGEYITQWGGVPTIQDIVSDDRAALRRALQQASSQDVIVTSGGSSAGKRDILPETVDEIGDLYVHHVAIKPGHPVGLASVDDTPVFLLPGYPVSALLNAVLFLRPALAWLQGRSAHPFPTTTARLQEPVSAEHGVRRFERVRIESTDGRVEACPVRKSGAGALTSVTVADGWIVLDEETTALEAGETVPVEHWDRFE